MARVVFVLFSVVLATVLSETVDIRKCDNVSDDKCKIKDVSVNCHKKTKQACKLKKGLDYEIKFNFTPEFSTSNLKTAVFWANGVNDAPFGEMEPNACKLTTCPTVAGKDQEYSYSLHVGTKLPTGKFPLKWKVYDGDNDENICCFMTTVKLER